MDVTSSRLSSASPYPFVPEHLVGVIVEKDSARMILWTNDGSVEAWTEVGATGTKVDEETKAGVIHLKSHVDELLAAGIRRPTEIVDRLEREGYEQKGSRQFKFASGRLYQSATRLSIICMRAAEERARILQRHEDKHPPPDHADWPQWENSIWQMNATALGARVLGVASLEALINEILHVRFPKDYERLEGPGKATSLLKKVRRLLQLLGMSEEPAWVSALSRENLVRRGIVHHEPMYEDDFASPDSVEPSHQHDAEAVRQFIELLDIAFSSIFSAFGVDVPSTHRPPGSTRGSVT